MSERMPLSKKLRFEVFKRDLFTCQYCGLKAPDVILHVDHIVPVAGGGDNDIVNLITACASCNGGKGKRQLTDAGVVDKSRREIEALQDRRNQLELLMQWREELRNTVETEIDYACAHFREISGGYIVNPPGRRTIRSVIKAHGLADTLAAIDGIERHMAFGVDGTYTTESVSSAFDKLMYEANTNRKYRDDPTGRYVAYVAVILRNNTGEYPGDIVKHNVRHAIDNGFQIESIKKLACSAQSVADFNESLCEIFVQWCRDKSNGAA